MPATVALAVTNYNDGANNCSWLCQ